MIVFDLRQIPKPQLDGPGGLGDVFFKCYVAGDRNPIFKALTLAVVAESLDRSAKLPSEYSTIDPCEGKATSEQLEQARKFFSYLVNDPELKPARYRHSRELFAMVLDEVNREIGRREAEAVYANAMTN